MKVIWLDRPESVLSSDINLKIKNKNTKRSNEKVSCIRAVLKNLKSNAKTNIWEHYSF
jgi:hypothetical protein